MFLRSIQKKPAPSDGGGAASSSSASASAASASAEAAAPKRVRFADMHTAANDVDAAPAPASSPPLEFARKRLLLIDKEEETKRNQKEKEKEEEEEETRKRVRLASTRERLLHDADSRLDERAKIAKSKFTSMLMTLARQLKRSRTESDKTMHDIYIEEPWVMYSKMRPPLAVDVGHAVAAAYWSCLESFDLPDRSFRRTPSQAEMHRRMMGGMLRLLYGSYTYEANEIAILSRWGFTPPETKQWFKFITPRRFGKTWAVSFMALASMLNIPSASIAIFSPSQGQSNNVIAIIEKLWADQAADVKYHSTVNKIVLTKSPTDIRRVTAYSASVDVSFWVVSHPAQDKE